MLIKKRMASGKYVDVANLKPQDVNLNDIEVALNSIQRFGGAYKDAPPLTVAQHTLLCYWLAQHLYGNDDQILRAVTIHDFPEYLYGDIHTGIKKLAMMSPDFSSMLHNVDDVIYRIFYEGENFEEDYEVKDAVKVVDLLSLDIERRCMWNDQRGKDMWPEIKNFGLTLQDKRDLFQFASDVVYVDLRKLLDGNPQLSFKFD